MTQSGIEPWVEIAVKAFLNSHFATPSEWALAQGFDSKTASSLAVEIEKLAWRKLRERAMSPAVPPNPPAPVSPPKVAPAAPPVKAAKAKAPVGSKKLQYPPRAIHYAILGYLKGAGGHMTPREVYDKLVENGEIEALPGSQVARVMHYLRFLADRDYVSIRGETGQKVVHLLEGGESKLKEAREQKSL